jgi:hypothetical protein
VKAGAFQSGAQSAHDDRMIVDDRDADTFFEHFETSRERFICRPFDGSTGG